MYKSTNAQDQSTRIDTEAEKEMNHYTVVD